MSDKIKKAVPEGITAGVAFIYYFVMALYKLTEAPIWQDEALDFYCFFTGKGYINGIGDYSSSYERLIGLLNQPPLYGAIMGIWLRISEAEWWLRFSSVLFGFGAAVGIYMVVKKLCDRYMAAFSVIIYSSIYVIMYYIKEMSEYIMIVTVMIWGIYLYLKIYEAFYENRLTKKHILVLTVFCVIAMYTQYGATFAVIPMAFGFLITLCKNKDYSNLKFSIASFVSIGGVAGALLLHFFFLPQSRGTFSVFEEEKDIIIETGNIVGDFFFSLMSVFRWFMLDVDRDSERLTVFVSIALVVFALVVVFVAVKTDKKFIKTFLYWNIATFLFYYAIVKTNVYAYGWFGNRYNMFIFPQIYVLLLVVLYEFVRLLISNPNPVYLKIGKCIKPVMIIGGILFCMYGDYRIHNHWYKMDLRQIVDVWYEQEGYNTPTFLDYNQRYSFTYYFTHDDRYEESLWNNIKWNDEYEPIFTFADTDWEDYMIEKYNGDLPDKMYVVTYAYNNLMETFEQMGYNVEAVVDTTADMYIVTK